MGPDEQSTSKYNMVITPINEDGTYGEPMEWSGFKPITEEDLQTFDPTEKNKIIFNTAWSGEFNVKFRHKKISKKTFKKWLMSNGFKRDLAELFCQIIANFGGQISYQSIYVDSFFIPTPHTLHNSITLEIHKYWKNHKPSNLIKE